MEVEQRSCPKLVRYKPSELAQVIERARACGRPVACYIRETSLGTANRARRTAVSDELIRRLAKLGNELARLSRVVQERQLPGSAEFDARLVEVLDVIKQLD